MTEYIEKEKVVEGLNKEIAYLKNQYYSDGYFNKDALLTRYSLFTEIKDGVKDLKPADVVDKSEVLKALEDVREKVDLRMKAFANAFEESTYAPTRDIYDDKMNECHEIVKIIDRKIAEVKGDK